jgi:hypothetical protein
MLRAGGRLFLYSFFTKFKLLLKQFTSIGIAQLERCKLPPSSLTAALILSTIADQQNILFIYSF